MKRLSICWIIGCLLGLVACRPEVPAQAEQGETDVFPDYREVTVPVNMAPPNFKLVDQQLQGIIRLKTMNGELIIAADHGVFNLPETDWKVLSQDAQGKQIDVTVYFREPQSDWKQMSFPIYVSRDSVDAYLVYRRIFPGYRMWNEMGIYQRCVENYVEKSILVGFGKSWSAIWDSHIMERWMSSTKYWPCTTGYTGISYRYSSTMQTGNMLRATTSTPNICMENS